MNIVITGGAGFLGSRLARTLLAAGEVAADGAPGRPVSQVTVADLAGAGPIWRLTRGCAAWWGTWPCRPAPARTASRPRRPGGRWPART